MTAGQLATSLCCQHKCANNNNYNDNDDSTNDNHNNNFNNQNSDSSPQQEYESPIIAIRRKGKPEEVDQYQVIYDTVPSNPFTLASGAQS